MATSGIDIPLDLQRVITAEQAWHYRIIPSAVGTDGWAFHVERGMASATLREELELVLGVTVHLEERAPEEVQQALSTYFRRTSRSDRHIDLGSRDAEALITDLLMEAKELGSSDIHIEAAETGSRIRIRVDGVLRERYRFERDGHQALVNKLKVKARLDIAEKRLPQDGRLFVASGTERTDVRVSVLPTLHGEKVVLRILGNDASEIRLDTLGMQAVELENYRAGVRRPSGLVLISGPTGSGKTTTLYATLSELNEERRNIITIEDPIEYTLAGINQVQLREEIGLTFPQALRTFLRQDPDVIMVGEVRDNDTAQMAIRAALTGHLVLSTIHTNSAWGTVSRLLDMGIPAFLLASALSTTVAQRLVRRLCTVCSTEAVFDPELLPRQATRKGSPLTHRKAVGCAECHFTGYRGRIALYEVVRIDRGLAELIRSGRHDVSDELEQRGIRTLGRSALDLVGAGTTSLEEAWPLILD